MPRPCLLVVVAVSCAVSAAAVPAQQPGPDRAREAGGTVVERAGEKMPSAAELKALRVELAGQVEQLKAVVNRKFDEAESKARSYALLAGVGIFAIMVLASFVGGLIVTMLVGRRRA